MHILTNT